MIANGARPRDGLKRLGLVCMTAGEEVRFKALTKSRLSKMSEKERDIALHELYEQNLLSLGRAIDYCLENDIHLYRVYSKAFPFFDTTFGARILNLYADSFKELGRRALEHELRLVSHPDQFVVLNSRSAEIVENSIKYLQAHADLFDLLNQPRSSWAACNIHPGRSGGADELLQTISRLPEAVKSRLTLENDEHSYGAEETLSICLKAGIPMVFDAHHHVIKNRCSNYQDPSVTRMTMAARKSWAPNEHWQMVHISNGASSFSDRKHSDFIEEMPEVFRLVDWIEVEAKRKDEAIFHLREIWLGNHR